MTRAALALAVLVGGCTACMDAINTPALQRRAEALTQGTPVQVERCGMFSGTRKGACRLVGQRVELAALADRVGLREVAVEPAYGRTSCLTWPAFGQARDRGFIGRTGVTLHRAPAPLATGEGNVRLVAIYVTDTEACMELEYPYG